MQVHDTNLRNILVNFSLGKKITNRFKDNSLQGKHVLLMSSRFLHFITSVKWVKSDHNDAYFP